MVERLFGIIIGVSLIGIGVLQAILGLYLDSRMLVGVGIFLIVLNIAYVYFLASRSD